MKPGVFREGGLERTWRTKILPLLEEHHYGEGVNIERRYGLDTLRRAISNQATAPDKSPAADSTASALEQSAASTFGTSGGDGQAAVL